MTFRAYVSSVTTDGAQIRISSDDAHPSFRGSPRVTVHRDPVRGSVGVGGGGGGRPEDDEALRAPKVRRSSRGRWIASITGLGGGNSYVATVSASPADAAAVGEGGRNAAAPSPPPPASVVAMRFRTTDASGLGSRRLRIGILTDPHVNFRSRDGKRLYGSANGLLRRYAARLVDVHGADCVVLPGDVCDTGSDAELMEARSALDSLGAPAYAVPGNHERDTRRFAAVLAPDFAEPGGYYSVDAAGGVRLVLLATGGQDSLDEGTEQLDWLRRELAGATREGVDTVLVFLHYSLILHPLHNRGRWDDGLQLLDNSRAVLDLLHSYPNVRAVVAGHKNVPSALVDDRGLLHTLSPQLIQVPCGYDVVDVYDRGLVRAVHEIEETELQDMSRRAAGEREASERWGRAEHRAFVHAWG